MAANNRNLRYYISIFAKRQLLLAVLTPGVMLIAFFLLSLYDPSVRGRILEVSMVCAAIWLIPILAGFLRILRFCRMVQNQEESLGISFSDSKPTKLAENPLIYLSDDWLIHAGSMALHRECIIGITWNAEFIARAGSGYWVKIRTLDKKQYYMYLRSVRSCIKIHDWWHRKGENDTLEVISELWDIGVF